MVGQTAVVHFSHTLPYKRSTWLKNAKAKGKKKPLIIVGHKLYPDLVVLKLYMPALN